MVSCNIIILSNLLCSWSYFTCTMLIMNKMYLNLSQSQTISYRRSKRIDFTWEVGCSLDIVTVADCIFVKERDTQLRAYVGVYPTSFLFLQRCSQRPWTWSSRALGLNDLKGINLNTDSECRRHERYASVCVSLYVTVTTSILRRANPT